VAAPFPAGKIKRGRASLIGGGVTGLCVLGLWMAGAASLGVGGVGATVTGVAAAVAIAVWVRVADL